MKNKSHAANTFIFITAHIILLFLFLVWAVRKIMAKNKRIKAPMKIPTFAIFIFAGIFLWAKMEEEMAAHIFAVEK